MKNIRQWVTTVVLVLIALELLAIVSFLYGEIDASGNIAIIKVEGPITDAQKIVDGLIKFRENDKVKAIVVRVESPGGAVGASQEIHDEIIKTKAIKPVIASFGNTAASGGYYIGVACDHIVSTPGTVTGSIGVITEFFVVEEVLKKFDLKWEVIKSGANKDIGSPLKDLSDDQRKLMQDMIDDIYEQFVEAVASGRKLDLEKVKELADGRIYTGRQALSLGLVDEMGSLQRAVEIAAQKSAILAKDVDTFYYPKEEKTFFQSITGQKTLLPKNFSVQYLLR